MRQFGGLPVLDAVFHDQFGKETAVDPPRDIVARRDREEGAGVVVEADGVVEAGGFRGHPAEAAHAFGAIMEPPGRAKLEAGIVPGERREFAGVAAFIQREEDDRQARVIAEAVKQRLQRADIFGAAGHVGTLVAAGLARTKLGTELKLIDENRFEFAWIVDFPMFEWNEDDKKVDFSHNPFSMPQGGLEALNGQDPLTIKAFQYDIACNGYELASGGIRNHKPDAMVKAFEIAGYGRETVEERFGGMFRAFHYGAPPHGGMAAGVDRIVMLLAREQNLREVALFPMNQRAEDILMGAPSPATTKQLRELHLRLNLPEK